MRTLQRELGFPAELGVPFETVATPVAERPTTASKAERAVPAKNPARAARHKATASRLNGTVKFFDVKRGFGFLAAPDGSDVFVHHSKLDDRGTGRPFLRKGDRVVFEMAPGRRGQEARNVKVAAIGGFVTTSAVLAEPGRESGAISSRRRRSAGGTRSSPASSWFCPCSRWAMAVWLFWHHGIGWFDLALRCCALRRSQGSGFRSGSIVSSPTGASGPDAALRIALGVAGSMAAEGSLISWVSHHRRHHVYADQAGDPHSPWTVEQGDFRRLRGLFHAHVGWLFSGTQSSPTRWSRDLLGDRDVVAISGLRPALDGALAVPCPSGWGGPSPAHRRSDARAGLGRPRPHRPPAPRHMECELARAHVRQAPVQERRPEREHRAG